MTRLVRDVAETKQRSVLAGGERVVPLGMRDQQRRRADFERMTDFRRLVAIVERCGDQSGLEACQVVNQQRAAVGEQRGHAIAGS